MAKRVVHLEKVSKVSLRQQIAENILPELEYCLLKGGSSSKASKKAKKEKKQGGREDIAALRQAERAAAQARREQGLDWTSEDKEVLMTMEIEMLRCTGGFDEAFEVEVRSLCHSRGVTADYLDRYERFNMKQVVLVMGNLGKSKAPWAELVQPAMYLHRHEFNILWMDIPSFRSNQARWMKFGPAVLRTLLRSYSLKSVTVLACGLGGAVFLEALAHAPELFGSTHVVYNMDLPVFRGFNLPIADLEDILRVKELQLWFSYADDEEYDRFRDGSPQRAYDAVAKLQARLQGERERGRRSLPYDELLITENLNINPVRPLVDQRPISIYNLMVFAEDFVASMTRFLEGVPTGRQADLDGGLVGDYRAAALSKALQGAETLPDGDVLPALRRRRLGAELMLEDRPRKAEDNKYRSRLMDRAVKFLELEPIQLHPALKDMGFNLNNLPRTGFRRPSAALTAGSSSRGSSRGSQAPAGLAISESSSTPALLPAHLRPLGSTADFSAFGSMQSPIKRIVSAEDLVGKMGDDDLFGSYKPQTPLVTQANLMRQSIQRAGTGGSQGLFDNAPRAAGADSLALVDNAPRAAAVDSPAFSESDAGSQADPNDVLFSQKPAGVDVMDDYRQQREALFGDLSKE